MATLTAAAFGQIFSDVSGVMFGGVVEDACARAGLKTPDLTAVQRQMPVAKRVIVFGSVIGVITGCLIGASSLLWLDLEAAERAKRAKELDTIFKASLGRTPRRPHTDPTLPTPISAPTLTPRP